MNPVTVLERIQNALPESSVLVEGEDCSFVVKVTSQSFSNMMPLERQRTVLALFSDELSTGVLHALSVVARTPDEVSRSLVQLDMSAGSAS
jgi:BolA protein